MKNDNFDPRLFNLLDELKLVAPRDSHVAARGRARFLTEAVSLREQQRHTGWKLFPFKEKLAMNILISAVVIAGLLFGGGVTVSAAQDDLPNQPLYQIKLMSEDAHLWFASDPAQQVDMLMEQAQTRLQEIQILTDDGIIPPADVAVRAQDRIQRALQIAAQLDETSQLAVLLQIQTRLQTQEQQMLKLEQGACTECVPAIQQTREMLRLQLGEVENRLTDPGALQNQNQNQLRINQTPQSTGTAIPPCGTCTPALDGTGQQNGNGTPSGATPVQQQNQTQEQNQIQQQNQGEGGTQNGTGSGGGSSTGTGGQGGKP
jgi:uncharacterized membrane protein YgcG